MGRRSTIEQLSPELTALCNRLIREGRTIAEIREHLNELGAEVSHGAMGRYAKRAREQMKQYREAQEVAGMWVTQLNENPKGDVGAMLPEMLKSVAYATIATMGSSPDGAAKAKPVKPMEIMLLSKALKDLEATTKQNIDRRERIEKLALERQAKAAERVAKQQGMSADQWAQIRAEFLGIKPNGEDSAEVAPA